MPVFEWLPRRDLPQIAFVAPPRLAVQRMAGVVQRMAGAVEVENTQPFFGVGDCLLEQ